MLRVVTDDPSQRCLVNTLGAPQCPEIVTSAQWAKYPKMGCSLTPSPRPTSAEDPRQSARKVLETSSPIASRWSSKYECSASSPRTECDQVHLEEGKIAPLGQPCKGLFKRWWAHLKRFGCLASLGFASSRLGGLRFRRLTVVKFVRGEGGVQKDERTTTSNTRRFDSQRIAASIICKY